MATTVDIRNQVSGALARLTGELQPQNINPAIGRAEVLLFQNHLVALGTNKLGWPSTGYNAAAARSTNFQPVADGVLLSVNQVGMRQRLEGGEIKPRTAKYLTLPARPEVYGRRAREFHNLQLAFHRVGGRVEAWALVEADSTSIDLKAMRRKGAQVSDYARRSDTAGQVMYWLVKSVRQNPDRTVLPDDEQIVETALQAVRAAVARALQKGGNPS